MWRIFSMPAGLLVSYLLSEFVSRLFTWSSPGDSHVGCLLFLVIPGCLGIGGYVTGLLAKGPYDSLLHRAAWAALLNPGPWAAMLWMRSTAEWQLLGLYWPVSWLGALLAMQTRASTATEDK
jgi:hypothetical protein